jgi:hypothetical protein
MKYFLSVCVLTAAFHMRAGAEFFPLAIMSALKSFEFGGTSNFVFSD